MDEISQWLKGPRDYETGAKLYLKHGTNHALRRIFMEPVSDFKKKKLLEVLTELVSKKQKVEKKVTETKATAIERISVGDRKWPEVMDDTIKALYLKWKPLFSEMNNLMSRIYGYALAGTNDEAMKHEAGVMAHRILDLDDMCDDLYAKRDHYLKFKKLPQEKKPMELVVDPIKMPVALENARRYVRMYKNELKKDPSSVTAAEKIKQYEWAVAEYMKLLKLD